VSVCGREVVGFVWVLAQQGVRLDCGVEGQIGRWWVRDMDSVMSAAYIRRTRSAMSVNRDLLASHRAGQGWLSRDEVV
jgi:hypothetical protein